MEHAAATGFAMGLLGVAITFYLGFFLPHLINMPIFIGGVIYLCINWKYIPPNDLRPLLLIFFGMTLVLRYLCDIDERDRQNSRPAP